MLLAVQDEHAVGLVRLGKELDARHRVRMVEVRGATPLADHPSAEETGVRAVDGAADPLLALLLVPNQVSGMRARPLTRRMVGKPAVDGGELLGHDQRVDDARAAAAVFLREERRGEAQRGGGLERRLHRDERLLRVGDRVSPFRHRSQHLAGELAGVVLELPLSGCHLEVDRHRASPRADAQALLVGLPGEAERSPQALIVHRDVLECRTVEDG